MLNRDGSNKVATSLQKQKLEMCNVKFFFVISFVCLQKTKTTTCKIHEFDSSNFNKQSRHIDFMQKKINQLLSCQYLVKFILAATKLTVGLTVGLQKLDFD